MYKALSKQTLEGAYQTVQLATEKAKSPIEKKYIKDNWFLKIILGYQERISKAGVWQGEIILKFFSRLLPLMP